MNDERIPYRPIGCEAYSKYELAIMHQVMLQLVWSDTGGSQRQADIIPVDIKTKDKKEYLIAKTVEGEVTEVRLDKIIKSNVKEAIKS